MSRQPVYRYINNANVSSDSWVRTLWQCDPRDALGGSVAFQQVFLRCCCTLSICSKFLVLDLQRLGGSGKVSWNQNTPRFQRKPSVTTIIEPPFSLCFSFCYLSKSNLEKLKAAIRSLCLPAEICSLKSTSVLLFMRDSKSHFTYI